MFVTPLRVAIVDDQQTFINYSKALLDAHEGMCVIATAYSGEEALEQFSGLELDAVIIDVVIPDINGFSLALKLLRLSPALKIVLISDTEDGRYADLAQDLGVRGFLAKQDFSGDRVMRMLSGDNTQHKAQYPHPCALSV